MYRSKIKNVVWNSNETQQKNISKMISVANIPGMGGMVETVEFKYDISDIL
jgi:hypothetical protein